MRQTWICILHTHIYVYICSYIYIYPSIHPYIHPHLFFPGSSLVSTWWAAACWPGLSWRSGGAWGPPTWRGPEPSGQRGQLRRCTRMQRMRWHTATWCPGTWVFFVQFLGDGWDMPGIWLITANMMSDCMYLGCWRVNEWASTAMLIGQILAHDVTWWWEEVWKHRILRWPPRAWNLQDGR